MADTAAGLRRRSPASRRLYEVWRRAVGGLVATALVRGLGLVLGLVVGLVLGLAACTGTPASSGDTASSSGPKAGATGIATPGAGAATVTAEPAMTPLPEATPPSTPLAEAPAVLDRGPFEFQTLLALRPGATYRLRMPGNLYPDAPHSHLAVELTASGSSWWLFEQGLVTEGPSFLREDAGVRVMELDVLPYGPCQDQAQIPTAPGPAPADLAGAILSRYPLTVISPVAPVERFGGSGVHLVAQLEDRNAALCDNAGVMTYRAMAGQKQLVELWIVDVQGERVIVERSWFPDTSPSVLAQQQRTLESLRLVRS